MCSAPKAPKAPKYKQVDQFQAYKQHSRYKDYRDSGGKKIKSDKDVRYFNEWLLQDQFDTEFNDKNFVKAFSNLAEDGTLTGSKDIDFKSSSARRFRSKYKKETGTGDGWEGAYAYESFSYSDESDLQRVYDEQYRLEQEDYQDEQNERLDNQTQMFIDQQKEAAEANAEMMEEMMNQPMYMAQQAALPKVQYKAKTPKPMPAQPAPAPVMNISPAPAPELVNAGNQMGIVKQSSTARTRSRQRTRGTASLT